VAFAPNQALLAFTQEKDADGQVVFWDAQARIERIRFDWGLGPLSAVAFSPDGCLCAAAGLSKVVVWDVDR
jgi:hypothetical protein